MGAGLPLLCGWSENDYQPETYLLDFTENISETDIEEYCLENDLDNNDSIRDLIALEKYNHFRDDDLKNILDELKINSIYDNIKDKHISELTPAFREQAVIIQCTENLLIVTTTDSEIHDFSIGFIPKIKYDDIINNIGENENSKIDWYEKRGKNWDLMVEQKAKKVYNKALKQFKSEKNQIFRLLKKYYRKELSIRLSPHTSGKV